MIIDQEFKALIPPLSKEEFEQLEANCLRDGIRDNLIVWDNNGDFVLIDGHNRYEIAQKHNLPYNHKRMEFPNREAVIEWIILNQFGRRNLSAYDRSLLALKLKPVIAEKAKERQNLGLKSDEGQRTDVTLGKLAGVGKDTIHKVEVIQEKASNEAKEALKRGDTSINAVYSGIKAAENETKKKQENRELREAKERHEAFTEQKNDSVVSLMDVKRDREDSKLLFEELQEQVRLTSKGIHDFGAMIERNELKDILSGADKWDLREMYDKFSNWHSVAIRAMRIVTEAINEK